MPGLTTICFDLFHTLVDVGGVPESVGRYTADILGIDRRAWNGACFGAAHEIRRPTRQVDVLKGIAHSLDPAIPLDRIEEAAAERQRRFDHSLVHVEETVLETLGRLRAMGLKLALVSNASTDEVRAWDDSPLAGLFEAAVFSCHCGYAKPEPEIYRAALGAVDAKPDEGLFVGDGGSDEHTGAAAVGLHTVLITRHVRHSLEPEQLEKRRGRVRDEIHYIDELPGLIERLSARSNSPSSTGNGKPTTIGAVAFSRSN